MLRQFRETESVRFDVRRASGQQRPGHRQSAVAPGFDQLPGAMNEALAVTYLLGADGVERESLIWDTAGQARRDGAAEPSGDGGWPTTSRRPAG